MGNLIRCDCCMGLKRIKGLGSIEKECPACRGIGWIEEIDKNLAKEVGEKFDLSKEKKKRGRQPKSINKEIPILHV